MPVASVTVALSATGTDWQWQARPEEDRRLDCQWGRSPRGAMLNWSPVTPRPRPHNNTNEPEYLKP
jgi:hypothetical protein